MAIETGVPHGRYATVALADDRIRLELVPELGAKVVSLVDLESGRDWLTHGEPPPWAGDADAAFGGPVAYGWDECLPTISPCPDPVFGGMLRDHGDLWGRPTRVDVSDGLLDAAWDGLRWPFHLRRRLRLSGPGEAPAVVAAYELQNRGLQPLPLLWSMHPLLALGPGSRLHLVGLDGGLRLDHQVGLDLEGAHEAVDWPVARTTDGESVRLDEVRGPEARQALKLYGKPAISSRAAAETTDGSWLGFEWDVAAAPYVGLWLDHGGWPPDRPSPQVGIEPSTAGVDDLTVAIARGEAVELPPRGRLTWTVRLELGREAGSLEAFLGARPAAAG
ncbi:MAG TPA: hypothetical protein VF763_02640 [Candidatus Limnocylindrales bacterium]